MSSLPAYAKVLNEGYSEDFDPGIEKTDMERGLGKQRIKNTFVTMQLNFRVYIEGRDNVLAFDTWYFNDIKRIGFFTMTHPRTGQLITCRLVDGKLGSITQVRPNFGSCIRDLSVEYVRTS